MKELRHIAATKDFCGVEEYRNIVARIVIKYFENKVRTKRELQQKLNTYLMESGMKVVSYNFVVRNSKLNQKLDN